MKLHTAIFFILAVFFMGIYTGIENTGLMANKNTLNQEEYSSVGYTKYWWDTAAEALTGKEINYWWVSQGNIQVKQTENYWWVNNFSDNERSQLYWWINGTGNN